MENDLVSIIIPVYNVEKYLKACIESAINQDYENLEVILINDGSTDNSKKICEEYASKNTRIKFINQENLGVSVARNKGIDASSGKWIMFVDGDDYMEKSMVSVLVNQIRECNADIVITPPILEYDSRKINGVIFEKDEIFEGENKDKLLLNIICRQYGNNNSSDIGAGGPWGKIYKKDFIKNNELEFKIGLKRMQDVIFNLNAMNAASKIYYKEKYLYHYRINGSSVCLKYNPEIFNTFFDVFNEFEKFIVENKKEDSYKQALYYKKILMFIEGCRISVMHKDNKMTIFNKVKELKSIYNNEHMKEAFENVNLNILNFKMKLFVMMAKLNLFIIIYIMIYIFMKSKRKEQQ